MEQSKRIQTSILNGVEKKFLVWCAAKMPTWVTSDMLSFFGATGALVIAAGYILSDYNIQWLWLSSFGFIMHWFGDSMDGTIARVRNTQRPIYGYYLDHTLDAITESFMFLGLGLSNLIRLDIAMLMFAIYLMLTINVAINAHLKKEFKLTYFGLGPTEFRVLAIIINTVMIFVPCLRQPLVSVSVFSHHATLTIIDLVGLCVVFVLALIYAITVYKDWRDYAKMDPLKKND